MSADTLLLRLLFLSVSGWVHRQQQEIVEYLVEENRVLREQIGERKFRFTVDQQEGPGGTLRYYERAAAKSFGKKPAGEMCPPLWDLVHLNEF